jgi:DNA-binding protein H-NS
MVKKTYQTIQAEIKKLQQEAQAIRDKEIAEVIVKIKSAIAVYGITAQDLGLAAPAGRAAKPAKKTAAKSGPGKKKVKAGRPAKFRDEAGNSWSGIGKRPTWFNAALAAGKKPDELLVK